MGGGEELGGYFQVIILIVGWVDRRLMVGSYKGV